MSLSVTIDPDLNIKSQKLAELFAYWSGRCGKRRMPTKGDIDPLGIAPHIWPYLELVDVFHCTPMRLQWRLIGTHVTEAVGRDSTGKFFDELYGPDDYETLAMPFSWVVQNGRPTRLFGNSGFVGKDWGLYEGVYMPLSTEDEVVGVVLGGVHYQSDV